MKRSSLSASALVVAVVAGTTLMSGCGGSGSATVSSAAATASSKVSSAASAVSDPASSALNRATGSSTAVATKVNANTAGEADLAKALQSAGVKNAEKISKEIVEYRPYTASDIKTKLADELQKYGVGSDQLTKILSVLTV